MAKKSVKTEAKNKLSKEEATKKIGEILQQSDIEQVFLAIDFGEETATFIKMEGEDGGEKLSNLERLLTMVFCKLLPHADEKDYVSQGEVDFAHLFALDLAMRTLQLGATDVAEIEEDLMPGGDTESWIAPDDVIHALKCETPAEYEEEIDEAEKKDDIEELLNEVFGKGKTFTTKNGDKVVVSGGKLSKEDGEKLIKGLMNFLKSEDKEN